MLTPPPTILLVDDEPDVLTFMREVLENAGYGVLSAPGGAEALRLVTQHPDPIPLVVTDVLMPGMGGLDLERRLLAERPTTKVLYVSGYADAKTIAATGSMAPILQKPLSADTFLAMVRDLLAPPAPA
jgi:two-component system, cell cycle sensor histidine kinase and response regulator CckA